MSYSTTSAYKQSPKGPTSRVHKTAHEEEEKEKEQSNTMMIVVVIIILLLLLGFFMMKKPAVDMKGGDLFLTDTNGFSATSQ